MLIYWTPQDWANQESQEILVRGIWYKAMALATG